MSRPNTRNSETARKEARTYGPLVLVLIGAAILVGALLCWILSPSGGASLAAPAPTQPHSTGSANNAGFQRLVGRWRRPDGGYVLEIKRAEDSGALDAGYFNPNSIHVSQAKVSVEGSNLKVFVELRDVNYPGSNYTLIYDAASDQLKGVYFQAVEQQRYEVFFARLN